MDIKYSPPGPVAKAFLESDVFARLLVGPVGSGKSTACVMEILRRLAAQRPGPDGIRRSRWAIIRNTAPELKSTTLKTYQAWMPEGFGKLNMSPPITHRIRAGDIDAEIIFLAMDRPEDQSKLLSLELTGAWVNEARELPFEIIRVLTSRVGRYPAMRDGGPSWYGVILDTNPMDQESDLYRVAEVTRPDNWAVFRQPSGLSADAENLANLPRGYYQNLLATMTEDQVRVFVRAEYGFVMEGKVVYPQYSDTEHCVEVEPAPELKLVAGLDLGLTPALVLLQRLPDGECRVLDEVCAEDMSLKKFAEVLNGHLATNYPGFEVVGFYDPAGDARSQNDGKPIIDVIKQRTRVQWHAAPSNDFEVRRNAVSLALERRHGFYLHPRCSMLRQGFTSKYYFKRVQDGSRGYRVSEVPVKNKWSHSHDGLQYAVLGAGGYDDLYQIERKRHGGNGGPRVAEGVDYDPFTPNGPPQRHKQGGKFETKQAMADYWRNRGTQSARRTRVAPGADSDGWGE